MVLGANSVVLRQKRGGIDVASKMIKRGHDQTISPEAMREMAIMAKFCEDVGDDDVKKHIVQFYKAELDDLKWIKLYLKLMGGGTLANLLWDPTQAANVQDFFRQLMLGLSFIHKHNFIHWDLKPANLLLTTDQKVLKIADFSLLKLYAEHAFHTIVVSNNTPNLASAVVLSCQVCTLYYRPLKLLLGFIQGEHLLHYGLEVDMWFAECIVWELAEQRPLFVQKKLSQFPMSSGMDQVKTILK